MRVRCEKNGADHGPAFTDGKVYDATHYKNALWEIFDDMGRSRYIIPDEPCPHLVRLTGKWWPSQEVVGRFVSLGD